MLKTCRSLHSLPYLGLRPDKSEGIFGTGKPQTNEEKMKEFHEFISKAKSRESSETASKVYNDQLSPPSYLEDKTRRTSDTIRTLKDLQNRSVYDVKRLIETGRPPDILSSELQVELLTAWRVRLFFGLIILASLIYIAYRLRMIENHDALSILAREAPYMEMLKDIQSVQWLYIQRLCELVRIYSVCMCCSMGNTIYILCVPTSKHFRQNPLPPQTLCGFGKGDVLQLR